MKITKLIAPISLYAVVIFSGSFAHAQSCPGAAGCLDAAFGSGGLSTTYAPSTGIFPNKGAAQSDGKILALIKLSGSAYTDAVIRYNQDGTLDPGFGNGGMLGLNWTGANNTRGYAYAVAIQSIANEDRIVVAGAGVGGSGNLRVERFHSDGSPDTTFGVGGTANLNVGYALSIVVQPDGKIVTMSDIGALVRLTANGALDSTFGSGGVVQNRIWQVRSIALQSNGRIVAAGYWWNQRGAPVISVWRFNSNGSLDGGPGDSTKGDSFGKGGQAILDSQGNGSAFDVQIDVSGKIVIGGAVNNNFAIARLTTSGQADSTFGVGGIRTVDMSGFDDIANSVLLTGDGKMVLTGIASPSSDSNVRNTALARFNANGSLDATFGQGGKVVIDLSPDFEFASDGMIQFDPVCGCEKIITVGSVNNSGTYYAVAARFLM
jgi:uncharacterized delta-60 repeat protein